MYIFYIFYNTLPPRFIPPTVQYEHVQKIERKELLFNSHPLKQGEGSDGDGKRVDGVPLQIFPPPPPPFPFRLLSPRSDDHPGLCRRRPCRKTSEVRNLRVY